MKPIYLDYAAATPMSDEAIGAMQPYLKHKFHNPSAVYLASRHLKNELAEYRNAIAHWLGANGNEIIFTAGASEADNLAIHGVMANKPDANVAVSAVEHEAVLAAANQYENKIIAVDKYGRVTTDSLRLAIDDATVLVSIMHANNETGVIQPLAELFGVIKDAREQRLAAGNKQPLYFHTDASQSAQYLDLHVNRLGADLMTLNAGKIYGPKQFGALYVRGGIKLTPIIAGGGQEGGLRSGTENLAGAAAMASALDMVQSQRHAESKRIKLLRDHLQNELKRNIEGLVVHGGKHRLPNFVSFEVPGIDGERMVMELDEAGIQCATGSACAALKDSSSHVLRAMGLNEKQASSTIRLSMGRYTTEAEVKHAAETIIATIKK